MRKLYFTLSFIFCVIILAFSQSIKETIPEFAEILFNLNKTEIKTTLTNRGFTLLSKGLYLNLVMTKRMLLQDMEIIKYGVFLVLIIKEI